MLGRLAGLEREVNATPALVLEVEACVGVVYVRNAKPCLQRGLGARALAVVGRGHAAQAAGRPSPHATCGMPEAEGCPHNK